MSKYYLKQTTARQKKFTGLQIYFCYQATLSLLETNSSAFLTMFLEPM